MIKIMSKRKYNELISERDFYKFKAKELDAECHKLLECIKNKGQLLTMAKDKSFFKTKREI